MIDLVRNANKTLEIESVFSESFTQFGRVLDYDSKDLLKRLKRRTQMPIDGNHYVAHEEALECSVTKQVKENVFGGDDMQVGYVNGYNSLLNALEYHQSKEVIVSAMPIVLILADAEAGKNGEIKTEELKMFYVPEGTMCELNPYIWHASPCKLTNKGFKVVVMLPDKTNTEFVKDENDPMLFKTNKWLLAHKTHERFIKLGAKEGLKGENIKIHTVEEVLHD